MELKFFAKPGQNGQIFVGLDSMIEFLRGHADKRPEHKNSILGLANFLEEELLKVRDHQKTVAEVFKTP